MLTFITNFFKPPFKNNSATADNRLAYISDINAAVIDVLNRTELFSSEKFTMLVTQSGATLAVFSAEKKCVANGSGCWSCLNTCAYQNSNAISAFVENSPGNYTLTLDPKNYTPYEGVDVQLGTLPVVGFAAVEKISATVFNIKTYNSAGVATRIFNNTRVTVTFFKKLNAI